MHTIDPIFVAPRFVPRDWGRDDLGEWCRNAARPFGPIGETWIFDPPNPTGAGPVARRLAQSPADMLGDLGRAPPRLRLVFPGEPTSLRSTAPVSLWHVLEPGDNSINRSMGLDLRRRPGERIRAFEGAAVSFAAGSVALEISSTFLPANRPTSGSGIVRLPPVSARSRATLFRDAALSVETWILPERSEIAPDGETCHVLMALTPGITIDGREMRQGETLFIPACGRKLQMNGAPAASARALVAYPDRTPTNVWRHVPGPDPEPSQLPLPEPASPSLAGILRSNDLALAA